jgi:hypothetical protein
MSAGHGGIEQYLSARFRGNRGHDCRPAGRGTSGREWTCPECDACWRCVEGGTVIRTMTWERADLR